MGRAPRGRSRGIVAVASTVGTRRAEPASTVLLARSAFSLGMAEFFFFKADDRRWVKSELTCRRSLTHTMLPTLGAGKHLLHAKRKKTQQS